MFITKLSTHPDIFVYVVVTMVFSIVLHELAHGWAAIWQGDRTPIVRGHMTIDPRVHMGAVSLIMLALVGMCFGAMPIDPTRFRSRYGEAMVAAAGPLMNLLLALLTLTGVGIWQAMVGGPDALSLEGGNLLRFFMVFGLCNIALFLFNLIPVPPLDGSTVLANLNKRYARMIRNVQDPRVFLVALIVVFLILSSSEFSLFGMADRIADNYVSWVISMVL